MNNFIKFQILFGFSMFMYGVTLDIFTLKNIGSGVTLGSAIAHLIVHITSKRWGK